MFDHYIAVDWAQTNMAIARMTNGTEKIVTIDVPSNVKELQLYLTRLKGKKILTFEETTPSHWLYTELKEFADEILVCDPYRNHLLSEGPKNDRIDAEKLVKLLRAGLLKPVFHSGEALHSLRKIVSGYEDVVKAGVRQKNQRAALFRAVGLSKKETVLLEPSQRFVLQGLEQGIESYEKEKSPYEEEFKKLYKQHQAIRNLESVPGVGIINAVKILAMVVDPRRFKDKGHFISYCGLIKHEKMSGGKSYGQRSPRYCRILKCVFKTGAMSASFHPGPMRDFYTSLIQEHGYADYNARNRIARRIATLCYGVLKSGKKLDLEKLKCNSKT